jgi:tRNA threonylcarbamoyladenosine biosynthesis protein TsaE
MRHMSTVKTLQIDSTSSADTERIGEHIGQALKGSEVIELVSDLGGGKTTFVTGLARGAGSTDRVASPTFTISKVYKAGKFDIYHFDFYRLADAGLVAYELHDVVGDPGSVVVVEWGGVVETVLPPERLTIALASDGETARKVRLSYPASLAYLVEGL